MSAEDLWSIVYPGVIGLIHSNKLCRIYRWLVKDRIESSSARTPASISRASAFNCFVRRSLLRLLIFSHANVVAFPGMYRIIITWAVLMCVLILPIDCPRCHDSRFLHALSDAYARGSYNAGSISGAAYGRIEFFTGLSTMSCTLLFTI